MRLKIPMRKSIIIILCFFLSLGIYTPSISAAPTADRLDGYWQDTFNDTTNLKLKDTNLVNGAIELIKGSTEYKDYDFANTQGHYAYAYRTFFFFRWGQLFSPSSHTVKEDIFDEKMNDSIRVKNNEYANWSGTWFKNVVVHHFRFKLHSSSDIINTIQFSWYGRITKAANIEFFFWNSSKKLVNGRWDHLGYAIGGDNIIFNGSITGGQIKYALDENNVIDICVVAKLFRFYLSECVVSTDYVSMRTTGEQGYKIGAGYAETLRPIAPGNISSQYYGFYWEMLTWDDYQGEGTTIHYQLLYENSSTTYDPVPDKYFINNPKETNSVGFTQPPVYLSEIPYEKLKIRAKLNNTKSPFTTPRIFSWALTWQNSSQWQDLFNSAYRVDVKNRIIISNGTVDISRIQGEWPMFGYNPENNRATSGPGPSVSSLYWYSEHVGGRFRNPVIGNGKVYIVSDTKTIYEYNMEAPSGTSKKQPYLHSRTLAYDIVASPVVTDQYVIVATGQTGEEGHINSISALNRENISDENLGWEFTNNNVPICYFSSPVVAGDNLYITTWGGDIKAYLDETKRYKNNQLLILDLNDPTSTPLQKTLSAPSYATPAVSLSSDIVVAGCSSSDNDSVYAFDLDGNPRWSKKLGAVGYASPVIYEGMVFVTTTSKTTLSLKTLLYALNLTDGSMLWNTTVCESVLQYSDAGDSTPAVFDDVLYVASPDGMLYAFHASDGTVLWSTKVHSRTLSAPQSMMSSPVYADGHVYLGVPSTVKDAVQVVGVSTTSHEITWSVQTFFQDGVRSQVLGSPIVSNGLLFVADESNNLYSFGAYKTPSQQVNGSIISMPIKLPASYWWNKFYGYISYNKSYSQIGFKLVDENNKVLNENLQNGSSLLLSSMTLPRTIRLRADFNTQNISANNPQLLQWRLTFIEDVKPPFLDIKSITPSFSGWLNIVVPQININAKDNDTGLLVSSAQYIVQYVASNNTYTNTYRAYCTGLNGTTAVQTVSANLSEISDYPNITALKSITFSIRDLAGNTATKYLQIKQDIVSPVSYIPKQSIKQRYNESAKYIWVNATTFDNGTDASGVKLVELFYRYSSSGVFSGDWVLFSSSTQKSARWSFNFTEDPGQPGGYFELCTRATDNAGNIEAFPTQGDVFFLYDWTKPDYPSFSGEILWFKELPVFSVSFSDDFRLDTLQYQPNFETTWSTIASRVNASTYNTESVGHSWVLKQDYWDRMMEGEVYYLYFRINDTSGNTLLVTSNNDAIIIRKDTSPPNVLIDIPDVQTQWTWTDNFKIAGLGTDKNGSGIKEALLYYRFSEDNVTWGDWSVYGDILDSLPYEWQFTATEGDGYYQVRINVTDYAGNIIGSRVIGIGVASFPLTLSFVLVGLIIVFLLISMVLFFKWRKKKET